MWYNLNMTLLQSIAFGIILGLVLAILQVVQTFQSDVNYIKQAARTEASVHAKTCDAKYGANNLDFDHCMAMEN